MAPFEYIGTFKISDPVRHHQFVRFTAVSDAAANQKMRDAYGENWSFARRVTADDPDPAGIERWGLDEIEFGS